MVDIFISYARENRNKAKMIVDALEKYDLNAWWDDRIEPGKPFDDIILKALEKAKCIIVLWSNASVKSKWVKEEAIEGLEREILIPVLIEDVEIPIGFRRIHTINLVDWEGNAEVQRFSRLLNAVLEITRDEPDNISLKKKISNPDEKLEPNPKGTGCAVLFFVFITYWIAAFGFTFAWRVSEYKGPIGLALAFIIIVVTIMFCVFIWRAIFPKMDKKPS